MSRGLRSVGSAIVLASALAAPAGAELENQKGYPWHPAPSAAPPGGAATAIVVRITGGLHPAERWVWFDGDGTARMRGTVVLDHGVFRAHTDFGRIARLADETGLCTQPAPPPQRAPGMDMFVYRLTVRCGSVWRSFTTLGYGEEEKTAQAARVVRALRTLTQALEWVASEENVLPPDRGGLFHTAELSARP